jgi:hypothetical protein
MRRRQSLVLCLFLVAAAGCDRFQGSKSEEPPATHADLLIGHNLLQDSLSGEGGLGMLRVFEELTFGHVGEDVQNLMKALGKVSRQRADELKKLRALEPDVSGKPPPSPIGDAIQAAAEEAGKHDMLHPDGTFSVRFLFLQAQAARMISVIAEQAAKIEPNAERRKWLKALAKEYAGYHDVVVTVVEKHSRFRGDEP